jgi:Domain of unknown function (DUF1707)/Cell wall-active antibiotics response 4TMS YvqF
VVSGEEPDTSGSPSGGVPELRASDQDRDEALQLLAAAAGDGRLTLEEYSERADAALGARTRGELERVTGDLRGAVPHLPAEAPQEMTAILSSQTRTGRWRVPARLDARSVLGDCHIELQDAVLTSPVTTIEARTVLGSVTIFVPDGVEVRLSGSVILGSHVSEVSSDALPGAPVIDVRARAVLGSVTIKRARLAQQIRGMVRDAVGRRLPPGDAGP